MNCISEMLFFFKTKFASQGKHNTDLVNLKFEHLNLNIGPIVMPQVQVPPIRISKSLYVAINIEAIERENANRLIPHEVGTLYGSWSNIELVGALELKDDKKRKTGRYSLKDFCSHRLELPPQGSAVFESDNKIPDNTTARVEWKMKQ